MSRRQRSVGFRNVAGLKLKKRVGVCYCWRLEGREGSKQLNWDEHRRMKELRGRRKST